MEKIPSATEVNKIIRKSFPIKDTIVSYLIHVLVGQDGICICVCIL